jgi:hypothetical protein
MQRGPVEYGSNQKAWNVAGEVPCGKISNFNGDGKMGWGLNLKGVDGLLGGAGLEGLPGDVQLCGR